VESQLMSTLCPYCKTSGSSVHSFYFRTIKDLPAFGNKICIHLKTRKFYCRNVDCDRKFNPAEIIKSVFTQDQSRRHQQMEQVKKLNSEGVSIKQIAKVLKMSRVKDHYYRGPGKPANAKYIGHVDRWYIQVNRRLVNMEPRDRQLLLQRTGSVAGNASH
jgi:hypothetical protein